MKVDTNDVAAAHGPEGFANRIKAKLSDGWPRPMAEAAFHGITGEIVRTIDPHTESDLHAVLIQHLVAFGNIIGRGCHWRVGGTEHHANLFMALVGKTSKGRKGTAWDEVRRFYDGIGDWTTERIKNGASSSEGIIAQVRDAAEGHGDSADAGIEDKRLLLLEKEFVNVFQQAERSGNTLSARIREAWETGTLETLTRNNPLRATGAHISIIGHITHDELLRKLTNTDVANGFANRFLWVCAKRSKELPDGGNLHEDVVVMLRSQLQRAVDFASKPRLLRRDAAASELWREVYSELTAEAEGMAATVCGRAEAQVMRLAMIYALIDHSVEITVAHLNAALAVWRYCEDSAKFIFGNSLGDPTADIILAALKRSVDGLSRTEISGLLGRNTKAPEIDRALALLNRTGRAFPRAIQTDGRPAERWHHGKG
jgi:hypothetical protein